MSVLEWVSYASPAVALGSAAISLASLSVARSTYRRAGPQVAVWYEPDDERYIQSHGTTNHLKVVITNSGLASIGIEALRHERPT